MIYLLLLFVFFSLYCRAFVLGLGFWSIVDFIMTIESMVPHVALFFSFLAFLVSESIGRVLQGIPVALWE